MGSQPKDTEPFKEYYGRNIDQMQALLKENRVPLTAAGLMHCRLKVLSSSSEVKSAWWDNYFFTADAILYSPSGDIKIALDNKELLSITPTSKLYDGALVLPESTYEAAAGANFTRSSIGKTGTPLTKEEAKNHPVWNALAREDRALLSEYVNAAFTMGKELFSYDTNMGVYVSDTPKQTLLRPCIVSWSNYLSNLYCTSALDNFGGRLIGVAPKSRYIQRALETTVTAAAGAPEK